ALLGGRAALGPPLREAGPSVLPPRRALVQLPGAAALQGEIRADMGAALYGLSQALGLAGGGDQHGGADWRGLARPPAHPEEAGVILRRIGIAALLAVGPISLRAAPVNADGAPALIEETVRIPLLGTVAAVRPADIRKARGLVLFVSGDGGWKLGVVGMARR